MSANSKADEVGTVRGRKRLGSLSLNLPEKVQCLEVASSSIGLLTTFVSTFSFPVWKSGGDNSVGSENGPEERTGNACFPNLCDEGCNGDNNSSDDNHGFYRGSDSINSIVPYNVGDLVEVCDHCGAMYFQVEVNSKGYFTGCCANGNINS